MPPHATGMGGMAYAMPPSGPGGSGTAPEMGENFVGSQRIVCRNSQHRASLPSSWNATSCSPVSLSYPTTSPGRQLVPASIAAGSELLRQ